MRIVCRTGSGMSAGSGLGTFRDKAGTELWARFDPATLATSHAFEADPERVHAFHDDRRRTLIAAARNEAHRALAKGAV